MNTKPTIEVCSRRRWSCAKAGMLVTCWLLALSGCGKDREALPPETGVTQADSKSVKVTVEPVTFRGVQRYVGVVGTLHGYEEISLGAKVSGRVQRITHDMADRVAPGELLLEIEPTEYKLNVRQAQRSLQVELAKLGLSDLPDADFDVTRLPTVVQAQLKRDNAQLRLERAQTLAATKATSKEDVSEKMSEFRVAQAEYDNQVLIAKAGLASIQVKQEALAIARQQLQDTLVRVPAPSQPIPGIGNEPEYAITSRAVAEGSFVMVGDTLFKLVIDRPLKFRGTVPERKIGDVSLGQQAVVSTAAYADTFPGEVTRINPAIDPTTRTFEVEVLIPNTRGELKPGGFAKTGIFTAVDDHAATVPLEALVYFAGITKIFLVEDNKAKEVQVTLGTQGTQWVEIASPPLPEGARVITSGQTAIADETPVIIRSPVADEESPSAVHHRDSRGPMARHEAVP